jgi:multimeric flavodoxin WrbA
MAPKILGVCCSLREEGNTEILVRETLASARECGAEVEFLSLIGKNIQPCGGCLGCVKTGQCKIDDDMKAIYPKLLEADGIIVGTPVFLWSVAGLTKVFMDRTFALRHPSLKLSNKVGAAVVVASRTGIMNAAELLTLYFKNNHMLPADIVTAFGRDKGAVRHDEFAMKEAYELGRQMVDLAALNFRFPPEYDCDFQTFVARKYGITSPPFE